MQINNVAMRYVILRRKHALKVVADRDLDFISSGSDIGRVNPVRVFSCLEEDQLCRI